MIRKKDEVEGD